MVFIWEMDLLSFNDAITLPLFNGRGTLQASGRVVVGREGWVPAAVPVGWGAACFGLHQKSASAVLGFAWTSRAVQDHSQALQGLGLQG